MFNTFKHSSFTRFFFVNYTKKILLNSLKTSFSGYNQIQLVLITQYLEKSTKNMKNELINVGIYSSAGRELK